MRARSVAAILSLALIYAFTCSAKCAICLGAGAAAETQSRACEHAAADTAGGTQKRCPAKPDCLAHHHTGFEFVQSDGLSRVQLSAMGGASRLFVGAVSTEAVNLAASFSSDLAPPRLATIFPQQNIFILRI
jgi:hypothetical protein